MVFLIPKKSRMDKKQQVMLRKAPPATTFWVTNQPCFPSQTWRSEDPNLQRLAWRRGLALLLAAHCRGVPRGVKIYVFPFFWGGIASTFFSLILSTFLFSKHKLSSIRRNQGSNPRLFFFVGDWWVQKPSKTNGTKTRFTPPLVFHLVWFGLD